MEEAFRAPEEELGSAEEARLSRALQRIHVELRINMHERERRCEPARSAEKGASADYAQYRRRLVEWVCECAERFSLHRSTFHTASNFLDRVLTQTSLAQHGRHELIAAACVRLAAKHCEMESVVPTLGALAAECAERCNEWEISQMEVTVLTGLDWRLHCNTAYDFLGALGLSSLVREGDRIGGLPVGGAGDQYREEVEQLIRRYAEFFVDLSVYEYAHDGQAASRTAASAVAAARMLFSVVPTWPAALQRDSGYAQDALNDLLCHLLDIFMHDFSDDWMRLQEMALGLTPARKVGASLGPAGTETLYSPTFVADLDFVRRPTNLSLHPPHDAEQGGHADVVMHGAPQW